MQQSISQTGTTDQPVQVESVQYNVKVGGFFSRASFAFSLAHLTLFLLLLIIAWTIEGGVATMAHEVLENSFAERLITTIALAVPLVPLHLFTAKRLTRLLTVKANLEDLLFKKQLRRSLWIEIIFGAYFISHGIYRSLSVLFLDRQEHPAAGFVSAICYGGAFTLLALWSYRFHKQTQR